MKYKNRLIVPTLISTALFGTALNAEAEEMPKESQETLIEAETVEAQTTEDTQKAEEQTPYINPEDVKPAEEVTLEEPPNVEEGSAQVSIEEEPVETPEEPTVENTEDEASQATPVPTSEGVSTEEAGDEPVEAAGSEENNQPDPVEEELQTLSETSSEDEGQQENEPAAETVIEDSEVEAEKASSGTDEEQSTESVKKEPEASPSEDEDGAEASNPQTEASIAEESELEAEPEHDKSPEEEMGQVEDDDVSSNEENNEAEVGEETSEADEPGSENEVSEVESDAEDEQSAEDIEEDSASDDDQIDEAEVDKDETSEADEMAETDGEEADLEVSEEELSKEAEAIKEDADDIVVDEAMEKELLTMLKTYDIEMDESKSFFTSSASAQPMTLAQAVGNINNYIKQNNFKAPRITYNHIAGLPKYSYRNGVGKPEGVVLHETANNSSTIHGEINWMSRNYNNAFVHAFVDKDNIIQVADTDHLAWGAGPNANPRFMHVELVRHDNKHDFAKSINNYTDYIANLLYKYKLPVDSAEADAKGTLWSHNAISTHLGGTNHIDPYTYFSNFGYSYGDVEKLIEEKYMDLYNKKTTPKVTMPVSTEDAKYVGRIYNSNKGLYESVTDVKTHSADDHINKTFYVTRKATYNYDNYYLVQRDLEQGYIGWVHEDDLRKLARTDATDFTQSFTVKNSASYLFDTPWGTSQQITDLTPYRSQTFNSQQLIKIDNTNYVYGGFGEKYGWVKMSELEALEEKVQAPSYNTNVEDSSNAVRFRSANDSIIYDSYTDSSGTRQSNYYDYTLFTKEKVTNGNKTFYSLYDYQTNERIGWAESSDLKVFNITNEVASPGKYLVDNKSQEILAVPYGDDKQIINTIANAGSYLFNAQKYVKVGALYYYYGNAGNQSGWIHGSRVTSLDDVVYTTSKDSSVARVRDDYKHGTYSSVFSTNGTKSSNLLDKTYFTEEKVNLNGEIYYSLREDETDRFVGWMKEEDLKVFTHFGESQRSGSYVVENTAKHLLTVPYGDISQRINTIHNLGSYLFNIQKYAKIGAIEYYYGKINGRYGWMNTNNAVPLSSVENTRSKSENAVRAKSTSNSGIFSSVYSTKGSNSSHLMDRTFFTKQRANFNGETYYSIYDDVEGKIVGWVKADELKVFRHYGISDHDQVYSIVKPDSHLLSVPYGDDNQQVATLGNFPGSHFYAEKHIKIGALNYYYGRINDSYGWVNASTTGPAKLVTTLKYGISLEEAVDIQMNLRAKPQAWVSGGGWRDATRSEVEYYLNPANHTTDVWDYTYLDLNRAQNISTVELNNKLLNNKGILHNQGTAFLQAANTHGVNEVYLISHALHETGNGQSTLAQGVRLDENGNISENGKLYYNMYGIAAYDHNPVLEGARYAQRMGWDTPAKAIIGGAQFISSGYFNRGQNTLYAMRWNPANPGTYQYATDVNWAYATARNLKNYYDQLGIRGQYYTRYTF
ncbi:N-acetylmuramoyl-L-alanine amidase [Salinicoccus roseus]|uniref:N-acetylmuramoyl-L-alanine amidase n=1 Tax=Salinicoccus roseus TaxID=45670 RepID=UPI003565697B